MWARILTNYLSLCLNIVISKGRKLSFVLARLSVETNHNWEEVKVLHKLF